MLVTEDWTQAAIIDRQNRLKDGDSLKTHNKKTAYKVQTRGISLLYSEFANLSLAMDRKPKQPKKSLRNSFSCSPISPVAGEALNRPLCTQSGVQTRGYA